MSTKELISIPRNGFELSAHLYKPEQFDREKQYPAIVVTHPGGGVKEQTAGTYASRLADFGFVTIAFDALYQGESGGTPHFLENPSDRVEDISWVIDYFDRHENVDSNRIGALGICAGGGYTLNAVQIDRRVKAVATVSGIDIGWLFRDAFGADPYPAILATLDQVADVRRLEANGADFATGTYVPTAPSDFTEATPEYAKEAYEYYNTPRAQCPTAANTILLRSFPRVLAYDALQFVDKLLTQPLLMIVGEQSDTTYQSQSVIERAASTDKELFKIPGATHVSLYDVEDHVSPALEKLATFFGEKLN